MTRTLDYRKEISMTGIEENKTIKPIGLILKPKKNVLH